MRNARLPALLLATVLQVLPVLRTSAIVHELATPLMAILFRWAAFSAAAMGGIDSVSGASSGPTTTVSSTKTYRGTNGVVLKKLLLTTSPFSSSFWTVDALPAGLNLNGKAGSVSWSIGGTPTVSGVFNVLLTAKEEISSTPDRTTTATLVLTIVDPVGVGIAPSVTSPPLASTVNAGQATSFTVSTSGTSPLTYFWSKEGISVKTEATSTGSSTFSIASVLPPDAGLYSVVVSNAFGKTSPVSALLTVNEPPSVTSPPVARTVNVGQGASFTVVASGTSPLTYFWSKGGSPVMTEATSTGSSTLSIASVLPIHGGLYSVIVSNAFGITAAFSASLTVNEPAAIPVGPLTQAVHEGEPVTLSVNATGTQPISYQWFLNNQPIQGATGASLNIPSAQSTNAGSYTVTAQNVVITATSGAGVLSVVPLQIGSITPTAIGYRIDWIALSSRSYALETRSTVDAGVWSAVGSAQAPQGGGPLSISVDASQSVAPQFIRLKALP